MAEYLPSLVMAVLVVIGWSIKAAFVKSRAQQVREALEEPLSNTGECVACGSRETERIAEGVVRCLKCDFTGGPGMAAHARRLREKALQKLPAGEGWRSALADLEEAERALHLAEGELDAASSLSTSSDDGELPERRSRAGGALKELERARALMLDAAAKLAGLGGPALDSQLEEWRRALEPRSKSLVADVLIEDRLGGASVEVERLLKVAQRSAYEIRRSRPQPTVEAED